MKKKGSLLDFIVKRGMSSKPDRICGLPLSENVSVHSDTYGIPHVHAGNDADLMTALGYLHGRDRLWQLESLRRLASGRLAEIAGPEMIDLDHFCRLAGLYNLHTRAAASLDERNTALYQAYLNGINGYIELCGNNLPLEFTSLNLVPEPFTFKNAGGILPIIAWYLQTNYLEEVLALITKDKMTSALWNELFPSYPGAVLPEEDFFEKYNSVKTGKLIPGALGFYSTVAQAVGNSNIWVHGKGEAEAPLLANDPHLAMAVPQLWYFCHLYAPGINMCGGSLPGIPGIIIGRTEYVAWGMTNVMTDCCDLYMLDVDPKHPTRYKMGADELQMTEEKSRIHILGGGHSDITIYRTKHGPVITEIEPGIEAAAVMKWYGTLAEGELDDTTLQGLMSMNRASSKETFLQGAELVASVGQNIVYADTGGNIGWYATGRLPKRYGYSGRAPADGSSGACGWDGFSPAKNNPGVLNPDSNIIINANHKSVEENFARRITYSWCAPYRLDRITELLQKLPQPKRADFNALQKDIFSTRGKKIVPLLTGFTYTHPDAILAADYLANWDFILDTESSGALVFHVFRNEFSKIVLEEHLGKYLPLYINGSDIYYHGIDHLLISYPETREDTGNSTDDERNNNPNILLAGRDLHTICEESLVRAIYFIRETLGTNQNKWQWGKLHTYYYQHPGSKGGLSSWLLNRGRYPAPGGTDTINLAYFTPVNPKEPVLKQFEVSAISSLRMIISLSDMDENYFIGPMGQSGMPGHSHYDDMIEPWMKNNQMKIPLSEDGVAAVKKHTLVLESEKKV